MSKNKQNQNNKTKPAVLSVLSAESETNTEVPGAGTSAWLRKYRLATGAALVALLIGTGVMAKNGWFPSTDALSGKRTGWFGRELPKNAPSSWNPVAMPTATPTPQLSKEMIYAGSRLLAVEDANATAVPPGDLAVWRPSNGTWYVLGGPGSAQTTTQYGSSGDITVAGDYDGDGKTDFSLFRPSTNIWYVFPSAGTSDYNVSIGSTGDKPAPADYDGDGRTDMALYRQSNQTWYIRTSSDSTVHATSGFGGSSDIPASADYDGDGKADLGLWRDSNHTFYSLNSSNGGTPSYSVGSTGNQPISADYDGDGKADYAVLAGNSWVIRSSISGSTTSTTWQTSGDVAVPNDYDGDGKVDIAAWHINDKGNGYWYIRQSRDASTRTDQWGVSGDIPVPALYRR